VICHATWFRDYATLSDPSSLHFRSSGSLPAEKKHTFQDRRIFRVLSDVLSDRKIKSGAVIEMRSLDPGQTPEPYAIVAVCFIWSGALLLRQFVPPRMLITNSAKRNLPNLYLDESWKAVACLHLDSDK
jgi:hypothetical protein